MVVTSMLHWAWAQPEPCTPSQVWLSAGCRCVFPLGPALALVKKPSDRQTDTTLNEIKALKQGSNGKQGSSASEQLLQQQQLCAAHGHPWTLTAFCELGHGSLEASVWRQTPLACSNKLCQPVRLTPNHEMRPQTL